MSVRQGWALCSGVSGIVKRIFVAWFEFSCTYVVASKSAVDAVWASLLVSAQQRGDVYLDARSNAVRRSANAYLRATSIGGSLDWDTG